MHGMRELENSHRVYGITGLSENFRVVMTELKNPVGDASGSVAGFSRWRACCL